VFARKFAGQFGARSREFQKFKTAVIIFPDGFKIDVATARTEYYEAPGALPIVEYSSIKMDLYRRDFTINTLALKLNPGEFGTLLDFFGAQRDLKEGRISLLHNLSFVEDPTRVFRAIRFEQRFDFRLSKHTQNLIKSAVNLKLFHRLSGDRITSELQLLFSETDPARVLKRMSDFDLLKFIHPGLKASAETERLFEQIGEALTWFRMLYLDGVRADKWFVYFLGLLDRVKDATADEILERLSIPARTRERVRQAREKYRDVLYVFYKEQDLRSSALYHLLSPLDIEALLLMMAKAKQEEARKYISLYLTRLREVKVTLTGDDLKTIGIPPGPRYRRLLAELLDARLDGLVKTRDEEINFIKTRSKGTSPLTNR
jgi:tRNA nucleotidyltransferase (CCA-adding enzyme)